MRLDARLLLTTAINQTTDSACIPRENLLRPPEKSPGDPARDLAASNERASFVSFCKTRNDSLLHFPLSVRTPSVKSTLLCYLHTLVSPSKSRMADVALILTGTYPTCITFTRMKSHKRVIFFTYVLLSYGSRF